MRIGFAVVRATVCVLVLLSIGWSNAGDGVARAAPLLVFNEQTGLDCNPCTIHLQGETTLIAYPPGVAVFSCQDEFDVRLYATGAAELEWTGSSESAPGCLTVNCTTGDEAHWPVANMHRLISGELLAELRVCFGPFEVHCDWDLHIEAVGHEQEFSTDSLCLGGTRRFVGQWDVEGDAQDDIEFLDASQPVEIYEEPAGEPCNPCEIGFVGESHITAVASGVVISACSDEFEGTVDNDGGGELEWVGSGHGGPGCNFTNCTTGNEAHWPVLIDELGDGSFRMIIQACYRYVNGNEAHCSLSVLVTDAGNHDYDLSTTAPCLGLIRIEGSWEIVDDENHDGIEIAHHGDRL